MTAEGLRIAVLGAGAWGTAVAIAAARGTRAPVRLWLRDAEQARAMAASRVNQRYLPQVALPAHVEVVSGAIADAVAQADLVVLGTPLAALRQSLQTLRAAGQPAAHVPVVWLCKGVEPAGEAGAVGRLPHEVYADVGGPWPCGVLSGPSFALEVAQGQPTALVAASTDAQVRRLLVQAFHGPALRVYENDDVTGVEVGGAVKNVLALATGICDGLELGLNARAALITRGLAEMTRLGLALGGRAETFMGLSGVGDLVLTATGGLSRNRKVGLLLAEGRSMPEILASLGHVAEGVHCARAVVQRAAGLGVHMPISEAVVRLLDGHVDARALVQVLLGRDPTVE